MPELDFIDLGMAVAVTIAATEIVKQIIRAAFGRGVYSKLAPLIAVLAASVATALLIDVSTADMQAYGLAVIVTAASAMGIWSGTKNTVEGVQAAKARRA
jgi:hypothetical protein